MVTNPKKGIIYIYIKKDIMVKKGFSKQKGVSPVIATILMVMITVGLVAFSYTWLMTVVEDSKSTELEQRELLKKSATANWHRNCLCRWN